MNKLILSVILILSSGQVAMGHALFPGLPDLSGQNALTDKCTNFSGDWTGACLSEGGEKSSASMKVYQSGCEEIKSEEMNLPIGGFTSINQSRAAQGRSAGSVSDVAISIDWNKGQTELTAVGSILAKSLSAKEGKTAMSVQFNVHLKIEGDRLISKTSIGEKRTEVVCEYLKRK